jgi:hypothetical protein
MAGLGGKKARPFFHGNIFCRQTVKTIVEGL